MLTLTNGEKQIGSFVGGKVNGFGTFIKKNGESVVGKWDLGILGKRL